MGSHPAATESKDQKIESKSHYASHTSISYNIIEKNYDHQTHQLQEMDQLMIVKIMSTHCIFSFLLQNEQQQCLQHFTKLKYWKGTYVYRQHDVPEFTYIISNGRVQVEIDCLLVKILNNHQSFGQDTLCFDSLRSESIRVISDVVVLYAINKASVHKILKTTMERYNSQINLMLNRVHFFNYLTNKEKRSLIQNTFLFKYQNNQVIFQKQQDVNSFFIIKKGTVKIQIYKKKDIIMRKDDYFGQSAFLSLLSHLPTKIQRMGRVSAADDEVEVYAIGLSSVKKCLGYYIRSIIFFNQYKWALFRDKHISTFLGIDYNCLLQLFNVKDGKKYSILAKKSSEVKFLFIPLEAVINKNSQLKLYCSQFLLPQNEHKLLNYDIIITEEGYYAYAPIYSIRQILQMNKQNNLNSSISLKLQKPSLLMNLTLTLKNVSKYSKQLRSSKLMTVLIVQDMKFGNEFVVKVFNKSRKRVLTNEKKVYKQHSSSNMSIQSLKMINRNIYENVIESTNNNFHKENAYSNQQISSLTDNISNHQNVQYKLVKREKQIIYSLYNKFVCGYYKCQQDANNIYMFMQYIKGHSLFDVMRDFGIMPQNIIKYFIASLTLALQYLHSNSVIYRDIKPQNIIIRSTGHLILVDFSSAKIIKNQFNRTSTIIGTPHYMAPEMIKRQYYTFNVDIWSLGVIFYQMITGRLPFGSDSDDPVQIFTQIIQEPLRLDYLTNKRAKSLLVALLQKNPKNRMMAVEQIKKSAYLNKLQFKWTQFEADNFQPFYFPRQININYQTVNNYDIFDIDTLQDWN